MYADNPEQRIVCLEGLIVHEEKQRKGNLDLLLYVSVYR